MNLRSSFSSVAVHSVFLSTSGKLYSWGPNVRHCLGQGDPNRIFDKPTEMTTPEMYEDGGFKDFAAGEHHNLILTNKSRIFVWGRNEDFQIGGGGPREDPFGEDISTPRLIQKFTEDEIPARVYCGAHFSAILTDDGSVYTMGYNNSAQLGNGQHYGCNKKPYKVDIPEPVTDVTCGWSFVLARTKSGQIYTWGYNTSWQLGIKKVDICSPTLSPFTGYTQIHAATNHALGIQEGGGLWTWGRNLCNPEVELNSENWEPRPLIQGQSCQGIACGYFAAFALMEDGSFLSWGKNKNGILGNGGYATASDIPKKVLIPENSASVAFFGTASGHAFFISEAGDLYLWGSADQGKLGMGSDKSPKLVPTLLPNWKWELPPNYIWAKWKAVFQWLFLGRLDNNSPLKSFPVEIIFQLVNLY